jgi:hypothetical protein
MRAWLVLGLVMAACSAGAPGPGLDTDRVMVHVGALLTLGPRPGDSDRSALAIEYLTGELTRLGAKVEKMPVGVVDLPAIEVMGNRYRGAHRVETTDPDLIVRFGPPGKALLVMAHYDTVPASPGAVDNAVAVGALLELSRALVEHAPPIPVMLVFTANEEIGLAGAEALAARYGGEIDLAIALDLIGGSGALSLNGASALIGTAEMRWLANAADRAGVVIRAPLAHRVISRWWPQAERSDHGPFTRRGIRALHLYHRGQDGEWIDLAYHSPDDVLARVDRTSVNEIGRLLRAVVASPVPAHGGDGLWMPVAVNTIVPRWSLVAFDLVLAVVALAALISLRRQRARGGLGLFAGIGCYVLAAAITIAIERLAAGDHPAPWLHGPLRAELALVLVFGGLLGLATRLARRFRPWVGDRRYLVVAAALSLAIGILLLAIGAAELAWIWLVPAAVIAIAPRLGRAGLIGVLAAVLPIVLVLAPNQLREAAWNGFLPTSLPLSVWLVVFGIPVTGALAWALRRRGAAGPLGTFILPVGCLLAILAGVVLVSRAHPRCTGAEFNGFHLACERTSGVR